MPVSDPYDVHQFGLDTSGRPLYMNNRMKLALDEAVEKMGFEPTPVQGAYMSRIPGGGADASAGFHDFGGCLDFRTWDITASQLDQLITAMRSVGWAAWRRNAQHGGMDPHVHAVLMGDRDAAGGARDQMAQYVNGLDGLASRGPDYERRPKPLVTDFDYFKRLKEINMQTDEIKQAVREDGQKTRELINTRAQGDAERDARVLAAVDALPDTRLTRKDIREAIARALAAPTEETP